MKEPLWWHSSWHSTINHVVWKNGQYWVADRKNGLMKMTSNWEADHYPISGPYNNEAFHLTCDQQQLWVSSGRTDGTNWNNTFNWHGAYHFDQLNLNRSRLEGSSINFIIEFIHISFAYDF